jgi:hypothetical protein
MLGSDTRRASEGVRSLGGPSTELRTKPFNLWCCYGREQCFPKLGIDFCLNLWYNSYINRNAALSQPLSQL